MASADEFLRVSDLLPEAMLLVDVEGGVVAGNRAAHRLMRVGELAGSALADRTLDAPQHVRELVRTALRTRELTPGTLRLRRPDGAGLTCRADGGRFRHAGDAGLEALALLRLVPREEAVGRFVALSQQVDRLTQEIAARHKTELALQAERERLRVTLWSIGDAVITTDDAGRVQFMNPVAEQLTGASIESAAGRRLDEVFMILDEETGAPIENPVSSVLRDGAVVGLTARTVLVGRDGAHIPIDDSAAPISDDSGKILGVVLVFHDISRRRDLEQSLRNQAQELMQADRRKDEFLAMLAHELRNPLAPLANGLQLLRMQAQVAGATVPTVVEMMERQLGHMTALVNDLLDVARITRGAIVLQSAPLALASALRMAEEIAGPLLRTRGQRLVSDLPPPEVQVDADPARLAQVFANLLSNASKFSPEGAEIRLGWELLSNTQVRVRIADPGIGMAPELLGTAFELFRQGDSSLDRSSGGLGVGLTVVRSLVAMHGGQVRACSDGPGRGSEFLVDLPLCATVPAQVAMSTAVATALAASRDDRRRVLVVDDNADAASSLGAVLDHWGFRTIVVFDGAAALDATGASAIDVVLMDIGLPGIDGYEVARRMRAQVSDRPMLLVAVTGYGRDEDRARALAAGFDHHLTKPLDLPLLRALLMDAPEALVP